MDSGTRTVYSCRLSKGFILKFAEGYPAGKTPEESRTEKHPKRCDNYKKGEGVRLAVNEDKRRAAK